MAGKVSTPPTLSVKDIERFWSKVDRSDPDGCWPWTAGLTQDGYGKFKANKRTLLANRVALFLVSGEWPPVAMHDCDNRPCCRVGTDHIRPGTPKDNSVDMMLKGRAASGDRNGSRLYPERLRRGDNHPNRLNPERLPHGDNHWTHQHPERVLRGDNHPFRRNPELVARGEKNGAYTHPEMGPRGERNGNTHLTDANIRSIRILIQQGVPQRTIARRFSIGKTTVANIGNGSTWQHVK